MVDICCSSTTLCIRYSNVRMEEATNFWFFSMFFDDMFTSIRIEVSCVQVCLNKIICYYSLCIFGRFSECLSHLPQSFWISHSCLDK